MLKPAAHRPLAVATGPLGFLLVTTLTGCAVSPVGQAPAGSVSDSTHTVVEGRINHVMDGALMAPYGASRPAWPAPSTSVLSLQTGEVLAFPAVDDRDGRFRWRVAPGAYVVTRIGLGHPGDEAALAWPRVVLCVPAAPGRSVYAGHLRLEGRRATGNATLSPGAIGGMPGVRYAIRVEDDMAGVSAGQDKRLMSHQGDMPIGETLQQRWRQDPAALTRALCGDLPMPPAPRPAPGTRSGGGGY